MALSSLSFSTCIVVVFLALFCIINVNGQNYSPAALFVGDANALSVVDPTQLTTLATWPLIDSSAQIKALTVDALNRIVYALVYTPLNNNVTVCSFNYTQNSGWGSCAVISTGIVMYKGGISYSNATRSLYITWDPITTTYVYSVQNGTVTNDNPANRYGQAIQITDNAQGTDVLYKFYLDDTASFLTKYYSTNGQYYVNFTQTTHPTCFAYEPVRDILFEIAQSVLFFGSSSAVNVLQITPFTATATSNASAVFAIPSAADPSAIKFWMITDAGLLQLYDFYPSQSTVNSANGRLTGFLNATSLTYLPQVGSIPINVPADAATTASFGDTPKFSIAASESAETTTTQYKSFGSASAGSVAFPTSWITDQAALDGGSGRTFDNAQVTAAQSSSSSYAYVWSSPLTSSASLTMNSLYNPSSDLNISTTAGQAFTLTTGAVKFSISISGSNLGASLFNNDQLATLSWGTCFSNDEASGQFNLSYIVGSASNGTVATYTFTRPKGGNLVLNVPLQAVTDGTTVTTLHQLLPPPSRAGGPLEVCVTWDFPYFNASLYYDPDIGVLAGANSGGGSGGDGDGNNNDVITIAVPVAVGGALVCCCIFIVIGLIIGGIATYKRKSIANSSKRFVEANDI